MLNKSDIISNTEYGLFAKHLNAGSVIPATGEFNFSLSEAYLIENGKITKPVKGAGQPTLRVKSMTVGGREE